VNAVKEGLDRSLGTPRGGGKEASKGVKVTIGIWNHPDLAHLRPKDADVIDAEAHIVNDDEE